VKKRPEDLRQHLSGSLDDEQIDGIDAFGSQVPSDSSEQACELAADEVLVHGLLRDRGLHNAERDEQRIRDVMSVIESNEHQQPSPVEPGRKTDRKSSPINPKSRRVALASLVAALAAVFLLVFSLGGQDRATAAMVSLEKIIEVAKQRIDRSYRIFVVEEYDANELPRNAPPINRRRNHDQIAGAVIHVRGPNEFVFVRRISDGRQRVSGCDGQESWAFREDGPVRVSSDLYRFRSGLPGRQQDLPFVNLQTHLQQLRVGYDIELTEEALESTGGRELSQLVATRKSFDVRGPMSVAVWFDTETGVVYQMLLDKLPRRGGGPKSVRLELLNPEDLGKTDFGPDFFSHDSHHEPLREVRYEDAR
jgi:hypothetical protein